MTPTIFFLLLISTVVLWTFSPLIQRQYVLLFFPKWQRWTGLSLSILVALLTVLTAFHDAGYIIFPWLSNSFAMLAAGIAYGIFLTMAGYVVFRMQQGKYHPSHWEDVLVYYKTLLAEGKIERLVRHIIQHHLHALTIHFQFLADLSHDSQANRPDRSRMMYSDLSLPPRQWGRVFDHAGRFRVDILAQSDPPFLLACEVYKLMCRRDFIQPVALWHPRLLSYIIAHFTVRDIAQPAFTQLFLSSILEDPSHPFIRELRFVEGHMGPIDAVANDVPILCNLLTHTEAAAAHQLWQPAVDKALQSLPPYIPMMPFLLRPFEDGNDCKFWQQPVFVAIQFIDSLVKQAIFMPTVSDMGLSYYHQFTRTLLASPSSYLVFPCDQVTNAQYIVQRIIYNMQSWLWLTLEVGNPRQIVPITKCLAAVLEELNAQENTLARNVPLQPIFTAFFHLYFFNQPEVDLNLLTLVRQHIATLLISASSDDQRPGGPIERFIQELQTAWDHFVMAEIDQEADQDACTQLETNVFSRFAKTA